VPNKQQENPLSVYFESDGKINADTGSVAIRFPSLCSMLELPPVNPGLSERPDLIGKNCAAAIKIPIVEDCER